MDGVRVGTGDTAVHPFISVTRLIPPPHLLPSSITSSCLSPAPPRQPPPPAPPSFLHPPCPVPLCASGADSFPSPLAYFSPWDPSLSCLPSLAPASCFFFFLFGLIKRGKVKAYVWKFGLCFPYLQWHRSSVLCHLTLRAGTSAQVLLA